MKVISLNNLSLVWAKVKSYVATAISSKQDTISDLAQIRSNAASGATAYQKPSTGIPASDLSSGVQTSLGKADTAIQSHQDISGKQDVINDLATIRSGASAGATALQPSDLADWAKAPTKPNYTPNEVGALPDDTFIPTKTSDLVNDVPFLTEHQDLSGYQEILVSGTNIKTLNNNSLVGSGNVSIDTSTAYRIRVSLMNPIFKETLYRGAICFRYSETEWLPSTRESGIATNKELTTLDFDPFGQIFYYSSTTVIPVGTSVNAAYLYQQYDVELRYGFNVGNTLTPYKAVYVKCEPLVDGNNNRTGRVRLASGQPIVQDLPTTADGFVYIYLGQASSEKSIFLLFNHPVYEYRNGGIRLWIGD